MVFKYRLLLGVRATKTAKFQEKISGFMTKGNFCELAFTMKPAKKCLPLEFSSLFYILGKYLCGSWYGAQKL